MMSRYFCTNWTLFVLIWVSLVQCPMPPYRWFSNLIPVLTSVMAMPGWTLWSPLQRLWSISPHWSSMFDPHPTYRQGRTRTEEIEYHGPVSLYNFRSNPRFNFDLFQRYLTLEEIYECMDTLAKSYEDIISIEVIGNTFEGRPIKLAKISTQSSSSKPSLWIDAGIHPREWISISTALYLIHQLVTGYDFDPTIRNLVSNFEWYILPVVNPDGYIYTWTTDRMWRKNRSERSLLGSVNCKGVDLNRNFDYHFGGPGSSPNPCKDKYPGPYPFSELETKAILNRTQFIKNKLQTFISMHSYDQLWMIPFGNTKKPPKHYKQMVGMANHAVNSMPSVHGNRYRIGSIAELSGFVGGGSIDWAYDNLGVKYAFAVELRDKGKFGFLLPADQIIPTGQEMWAAVRAIAERLSREFQELSLFSVRHK